MKGNRNRIPVIVLTAVSLTAVTTTANAHHSAAAFDMTQTVALEGVVTRYEWANPHVYLWLEAPGENGHAIEWEVEGQPPAVLRRLGWSEETLKLGDTIQAAGHPARNPRIKSVLLVSMKRADTALYDNESLMRALTTSAEAPSAPSNGLAGVWVTLLDMAAMQSYVAPGRTVPLTEAGIAARDAFDEATMSPGLECVPPPAPAFMVAPDVKRITLEEGSIRIAGEFAAGERVIHLAGAEPAASAQARTPSPQGYSVGRWEGATLVVETAGFAPHAQGIGFKVASSPKKRLVERLTLDADGKGLAYAYELTDPQMLTGPISAQGRWVYSPDVEFAPVACNLDNARRFLQSAAAPAPVAQ